MGFNIKRSITNWKHGVLTRYIGEPGVYDVVIPDGVVEIGNKAFYACSNLKRIVIPNGVTTIGKEAFAICYSLTSIYLLQSDKHHYSGQRDKNWRMGLFILHGSD